MANVVPVRPCERPLAENAELAERRGEIAELRQRVRDLEERLGPRG